jgi:hypothetical protein
MSEKFEFKPYPDGGNLRASLTKKSEKSADYWGHIAINLKDLTAIETKDGLHIVKLSGWKKQDKQGKTYLSLAVDRYVAEDAPKSKPSKDEDEDVPF